MVKIKVDLAHRDNYGGSRALSKIEYIVIHYTANDGDSDEGNANYFNSYRGVSAHYFVDDDSITQSVPDGNVAYSVGGKKYANCAQTGGGKWHNKCTNNNSISIELCDTIKDGKYGFTEKTLQNAADLCRQLMEKYNIPIGNVIRHFDVTGKSCPSPMVTKPDQWKAFKERIENKVKYYETLKEIPKWGQATVKAMIDKGCFGDVNKLHLSDDMLRTFVLWDRYKK